MQALSRTDYRADVLVVAGDITDKLDILEVRSCVLINQTCHLERGGGGCSRWRGGE